MRRLRLPPGRPMMGRSSRQKGFAVSLPDVDRFHLWLRAANYRPDTISRAVIIARQYIGSANGHDPGEKDTVIAFLAQAAERVKRVTMLNYHKDLAMFFRFAMSEGLVDENPLELIPKPRPSLYERERDTRFLPYTDSEFEALLDACHRYNWLGLRDRAILWVLWDTPLRVSEVCGLMLTDLDWGPQELQVRDGKDGVRYEALLSDSCLLAIDRYLRHRPNDAAMLFVDRHSQALTRGAVEQLCRRLARRADWTKPCAPHYFRHNWRVKMRRLGLDDAAISALMGHRSVVITHAYARQVARQDAKAQLRRFAPFARAG